MLKFSPERIIRPPLHAVPVEQNGIGLVEALVSPVLHEDSDLVHPIPSKGLRRAGQHLSAAVVYSDRFRIHTTQIDPGFKQIRACDSNHPIVQHLYLHPGSRCKRTRRRNLFRSSHSAPLPRALVIYYNPAIKALFLEILDVEFWISDWGFIRASPKNYVHQHPLAAQDLSPHRIKTHRVEYELHHTLIP